MAGDGEELANRYLQALSDQDFATLRDLYAEDAVQEWPQSGERIVGRDNIMAINENYPGMPKAMERRTIVRDDLLITESTLDYGGSTGVYQVVSIIQLRDGRIAHETDYFGAPFPAPDWRSQWVERM
jgi:ketosteroid isomerase-like protein